MDSDSYSKQQLDDLFMDMIAYYDGDPKRTDNRPEDALTAWL